MFWAIEKEDEEIVQLLLNNERIDPDSKSSGQYSCNSEQTLLLRTAVTGQSIIVKVLLAKEHFDLTAKDRHGQTPLFLAIENGHTIIVEQFLAIEDIDPNTQNKKGETSLLVAAEKGHRAVIRLLLKAEGIKPDYKNSKERIPLSLAI